MLYIQDRIRDVTCIYNVRIHVRTHTRDTRTVQINTPLPTTPQYSSKFLFVADVQIKLIF